MKIKAQFTYDTLRFDRAHDLHLVVSVRAPRIDWQARRAPLGVIPVLDVSGSMEGDKLRYARQSIMKLVDHLQPGDHAGLVAFATAVQPVARPVEMTQARKAELRAKVGELAARDCTNFSGGLLQGLEWANELAARTDLRTRVIMFTDGLANQGVATKRADLLRLLDKSRGRASVSAFGYGADADQDLLSDLAQRGQGNYAFVQSPEDALTAFARELGGLLSTYAQDLVVEIAPRPGHRLVRVLSDVDALERPGGAVAVKLADILGEEERSVVLAVSLSAQPLAGEETLFDVTVAYDHLGEDGRRRPGREEVKAWLRFVKPGEEQARPTTEIDRAVAVAQMVQAQIEAERRADRGDFRGAQASMAALAADLEARGLAEHGKAARAIGQKMQDRGTYAGSKGYLKSAMGLHKRAHGTSHAHLDALAHAKAIGLSASNVVQDELVQRFTRSPDAPAPDPRAAPGPKAEPEPDPAPPGLAKSRSKRW